MIVNFNDIEISNIDAGGGNEYYYNNELFTGAIVEYNTNNILVGEISVVEGSKKGRIALYYDSGQIEKECFESYNRMYGICKEWDENGILISETDFGLEYQP